jgi:hypothetical protein
MFSGACRRGPCGCPRMTANVHGRQSRPGSHARRECSWWHRSQKGQQLGHHETPAHEQGSAISKLLKLLAKLNPPMLSFRLCLTSLGRVCNNKTSIPRRMVYPHNHSTGRLEEDSSKSSTPNDPLSAPLPTNRCHPQDYKSLDILSLELP